MFTASASGGESCLCSLADEATFELGEGPHHVKDQPAPGRTRVDGFSERDEIDPSFGKKVNQIYELTE
ncbi:hypothetical protein WJ62_05095 [Burkholderia diffusa]|nr:hypothetical protein WJ62_05095 [Burkholderia diffusa]